MNTQTRLLIVDDNKDLLETFSFILKRTGFDVDTAPNGLAAVNKYRNGSFDVILMDFKMPEMNGLDAFYHIKKINPAARVILMTAYTEQGFAESALNDGIFNIIQKPLRVEKLIELIREATSGNSVLIVDDDPEFLKTLAAILEMADYKVITASSGEEAIEKARNQVCKIAFMDIKLPSMNGLEAFLALKEIIPDIKAVMMTGYGNEINKTVERSNEASVLTCLFKPFSPQQAVELVGRVLKKEPY